MTQLAAETTPFTTEDHWRFLGEFVREETALGGPDPHLATLGPMLRDQPWRERVWRCGLYAAGYNIPLAEAIWREWPWERARKDPAGLEAWVHRHWAKFILRRERRAVRTPEKFSRCLLSTIGWLGALPIGNSWWNTDTGFEGAWRSTSQIYGLGRYVQQKLIEALVRHCGALCRQSDIRAKDGTSPREGLALLFPERRFTLEQAGNSPSVLAAVEEMADQVKLYLANSKAPVDYFQLQVVLCEYKKSWQGKQYPGRTHDTELRYWRATQQAWGGFESTMLDARAEVFPSEVLGEKHGWWRQREPLEEALPRYRYTWSDLKYSWLSSLDVANPVPWESLANG